MANNVFANGRELSCKSGSGKSIACLPDVCMTPPENPATPPGVPVPYPNTGSTSDCTSGSTTVKISKKEASLKNKSYFKKSMGDEAGAAAKKGVVSSKNRGKVYFTAWSMDVKIEGENAVRHLDMTTHNHGSPTNTGPWPFIDTAALAADGKTDPCADEKKREEKACKDADPPDKLCADAGLGDLPQPAGMTAGSDKSVGKVFTVDAAGNPVMNNKPSSLAADTRFDNKKQVMAWHNSQANACLAMMRCRLSKKEPKNCCPGQTPHHLVDNTYTKYDENSAAYKGAPCICAEGNSNTKGSHGMLHAYTKQAIKTKHGAVTDVNTSYGEVKTNTANSVSKVFPTSCCSEECIKAQLDNFYKMDDSAPLTGSPSGRGADQLDAQIAWNDSRASYYAATRAARIAALT